MKEFIRLWEGGPQYADAAHFPLSTDTVLLSDFASPAGQKKGIDLGSAAGIIPLLLLARNPRLQMTGIEILPEASELSSENLAVNGFGDSFTAVNGDIRNCRSLFPSGSFDFVISNPPYFAVRSGAVPPDAGRAGARGEGSCTMEELCAAAEYLTRTGGSVYLVHKPERLSELLCCMTAHKIEPKRLRFSANTAVSLPNLVFVEGRRGGKPGMKIEPLLILRNADGTESDEYKRIYRR